jgi:hypothetical protein
MNRILTLLFLSFLVFSCSEMDMPLDNPSTSSVPLELTLNNVGIKLASNFVTNEAQMNIKLEAADKITIKIVDISGKVVSSEEINAKKGDNLLNIYTKTLPRSSYELQLYNSNNQQIGRTLINLL